MISTDKKMFEEGSAVRARIQDYGTLFEQLHVVVFTRHSDSHKTIQLTKNVWVHPTNSRFRIMYIFDYLRVIRQQIVFASTLSADIVSAQDPAETGIVAWIVARRYGIKLHIQIHTDIFGRYYSAHNIRQKIQKHIAKFIILKADGIRVVSQKIKDSLLDWHSYLENRIRVLPIFIDVSLIKNAKPVFDLHKRYPKFTFIILSVGRFVSEKNYSFMLNIFSEIVKQCHRAGLVIVGSGTGRLHIKRYIKDHNLSANVVVEPWQEDLTSYYKTANLFLLTSIYEGYGRTLVEAAAAGLPFIATDVGVASSLNSEQKEFVVCPVNDRQCFVKKIMRFISDNEMRIIYKINVRDSVLKTISSSKKEYLRAFKNDFAETYYFGEDTQ